MLYKCTNCGKITQFRITYGSIAHEEICPLQMPYACGFGCKMQMDKHIKNGSWVLPKLRFKVWCCDIAKHKLVTNHNQAKMTYLKSLSKRQGDI